MDTLRDRLHFDEHRTREERLYGEQTALALENMSFSGRQLSDYPEFIISLARVKRACAIANYAAESLTTDQLVAINRACLSLIKGEHREQFPVDVYAGGGGIAINMNLNEVLARIAGKDIDPVDHVNMSQSTSDVCHTAIRMTVGELLEDLLTEICKTREVLKQKAEEFAGIDTIARTCFQDGMKVSAGAVFEATSSALVRRTKSLREAREEMKTINLGWTVIGSGTGASETYREAVLEQLNKLTKKGYHWSADLYDAAEYPDDLADVSTEVRIISEILAKLSRDLRILGSGPEAGFEELILPKVQKGSSFFPGKSNPVIPETMIQCSMLIAGADSIIQSAVGAGEIHINLWEDMMGFLLMDNIRRLTGAVRLFREKCLTGIMVNREKCEEYAASSIPLIVDFKEKYGYSKLSDEISRNGVKNVVKRLRAERKKERRN